MIARYWSATTSTENAPHYARHLKETVFLELTAIEGFDHVLLLQRDVGSTVEVVVITFWKSLDSIRAFAGDDMETAVVADKAAAVLTAFDRRVKHYEVL